MRPGGGADVKLTIRDLGNRTLTINPNFHLFLDKIGPGGRKAVDALFVFPAPQFAVIAPGSESTFLVPIGTGEPGEPGADLSARSPLLKAEVFIEERDKPVRRPFSFEGRPKPS